MVELCSIERLGWTTLSTITSVVAAIPWLHPTFQHGKLMVHHRVGTGGGSDLAAWFHAGVPKRLFAHFYALGLATSALTLVDIFFFEGSLFTARIQGFSACSRIAGRRAQARELGAENLVCLVLLTVLVARRLWESLAVTRWGPSRMSFAGYAIGIIHYQLMVVTILVEAPPLGFLIKEVGLFGSGLHHAVNVGLVLVESVKFRHAAAIGLYLVGSVRQHEALRHLAALRATPDGGKVSTSTYAIPTEGWFRYVSCPHYFAELLLYLSFLLLAGLKGGGLGQGYLVALIWVFANQALVAARAHEWYQLKFEDYPPGRKRLIPGVW